MTPVVSIPTLWSGMVKELREGQNKIKIRYLLLATIRA